MIKNYVLPIFITENMKCFTKEVYYKDTHKID